MLLNKHSITSTTNAEDAFEGIRSRSKQFTKVEGNITKGWSYRFNRVFIGSARVGLSSVSHINYEQEFSPDLVVTGAISGVERMSVRGSSRHNNQLASFAPLVASKGEIISGQYWTVRLCPLIFVEYLDAMEVQPIVDDFVEKYWYTALPASDRFNRYVSYLLNHIEQFGMPTSMEMKSFEDLLYVNAAQLLQFEDIHYFGQAGSRNIDRCAQYIDENIHREITTIELARMVGMSVRNLQYVFNKNTGGGIRKFVVEKKLQHAKYLISHSDDVAAIFLIGRAVGFENPSYFSKIYKIRFGENPSDTLMKKIAR